MLSPIALRIGNPVVPQSRFDHAELGRLRDLGFNTIQLNIAWGSRPGAQEMLARFDADPSGWLSTHLRLPPECRW